jgi:hypothetical protein
MLFLKTIAVNEVFLKKNQLKCSLKLTVLNTLPEDGTEVLKTRRSSNLMFVFLFK